MNKQTANQNKRYLYAIITDRGERQYGAIGLDEKDVYTIGNGQIAAVVSKIPKGKIRPQRRNLAAHQQVLKQLMADNTTPLPVSFGVIADDSQAIKELLSRHQTLFLEQLERVSDKVEMGLRVTWDVPNIFEYFINTHDELREIRDRSFGRGGQLSQEEMIEIGRSFNRLLDEERETHSNTVEDVLSSHCFEFKKNKCREEREVMNVVCLVGRDSQADFEKGIHQAAKLFNDDFLFDYNGPWAPHNFVELNIEL